jgi:hypothetical protein
MRESKRIITNEKIVPAMSRITLSSYKPFASTRKPTVQSIMLMIARTKDALQSPSKEKTCATKAAEMSLGMVNTLKIPLTCVTISLFDLGMMCRSVLVFCFRS